MKLINTFFYLVFLEYNLTFIFHKALNKKKEINLVSISYGQSVLKFEKPAMRRFGYFIQLNKKSIIVKIIKKEM